MAIATPSRLAFLTFKVLPTFFIHRQNFSASLILSILGREDMFQVNRSTHTKDDNSGIEQYYRQSLTAGKYYTTNLVPDAREVNPLAIDNVVVYPREGFGLNNKAIDADSVLRNQPEFKNNRCNIRAQARPFLTVPFMGGGRGNADVESILLHSEQVRQGKEAGTVTEKSFDQVFVPLIPSVKDNIQNPKNLVTEVADPGWVRGGLPSRSYIRDVNC
jgi:hypothetical protein